MILLCTNELSGTTGYHKSVVETANALHRAGYPVTVLNFLGASDGAARALPLWPLDRGIPAIPLQTLAPDGGKLLHRNYHAALTGNMGSLVYEFTANQLAALREINSILSARDTVIFTSPLQALAFQRGLDGEDRRPRTVLQIHGDYRHHAELWDLMMEARESIDRVQTVASGLREQFIPTFDDADVVFIPNFPGDESAVTAQVEHEGINIALPASFQQRKNQLDAVRALAMIEDPSVHLTLWGNVNPRNMYYVAVRDLVESLDLGDRVHMPGFGNNIYASADIVLMTSLSEGFGYPLIEAGFHGLPAVAYDFDFGPRDAIDDGLSGFIVPVGDVPQLAQRLAELADDGDLRRRMGRHSRAIFDERFATKSIVERYRQMLGEDAGSTESLAQALAPTGTEPVEMSAIAHRTRRVGGRKLHQVRVQGGVALLDVRIDNGKRVEAPRVQRLRDSTVIEFRAAGAEVISYTTEPGSDDRHYLANTTSQDELEVLPYLRRDAGGHDAALEQDTIFAAAGGMRRLTPRELLPALGHLSKVARRDIAWKVRQVANSHRKVVTDSQDVAAPVATGPQAPSTAPTASASVAGPAIDASTGHELDRGAVGSETPSPGRTTATLTAARRIATVYAKSTGAALVKLARKPATPVRREIARHPRFPVTAGVDNFGTPINQPGGVEVRNAGSARRPIVSIKGEYDWLVLRDATAERRIEPPFSYGEFFDRLCAAEREFGLFERTNPEGVHLWELGRSALVIQLAEALGMWGAAPAVGQPVQDVYDGPKRLLAAPSARRVVFDYVRRGQSGYRTAAFRDDQTLFVVQPEPEGYPEVDDTNMVYPMFEYHQWRQDWRRRWAHQRVPAIDARPFEEALTSALGIRVDLGDHLRNRLLTFLDQRDFWTPVFEKIQPEEVLIAASHWSPGVSAAAARVGATVADIQYAETGKYHATFWFGDTPRYGATRLYTWSDYWAERTNAYQEHVVVPRRQPELLDALREGRSTEPTWDVCIISQPRVFRRILAFVEQLATERPDLRVVIAPHPVQRPTMDADLAALGLTGKVSIAPDDTLTTVRRSRLAVGCYSTSLWEAASAGCPTYVLPVPGHELTLADVELGIFRLANSPHDLVPYEVPAVRSRIFDLQP